MPVASIAAPSPSSRLTERGPESWLDEHGDALFHYALLRVRRKELSEDLVQETLLAALRGYETFGGRAQVRSWLFAILKNKIVDYYRKAGRETSFTDLEFLSDEMPSKFTPAEFWDHAQGPKDWRPATDEIAHRSEFWETIQVCLAKLPDRVSAVFTMREMDDLASAEICEMLGITKANLWVMLHRARMALRECLERNWFTQPDAPARR